MNDRPDELDAAHLLARELRVLVGRLKRRLREQANEGALTPSQASVLGLLYRDGPATVTTLARAEGVRPQSLGATVASLQAIGLVVGAPDPKDGRQTILDLTPACRDLIETSRAAREDWLFRTIQARLSDTEQARLAAALPLLQRLAEP
ncbi:MAG TPA: MarR family transcriptional regulator [Stellaceae bacterium]|nr:MarR family transcriptional regulator [Stellaceae bacterium]